MAVEAEITVTINGVTQAVDSFEELADVIQQSANNTEELNDDLKQTGKEGKKATKEVEEGAKKADKAVGPLQQKFAGFKETLKGFASDAKAGFSAAFNGIQKFGQGLGLGTKAAKGLAVGLSALGIPILLAAVAALVDYFKNFEGAAILVQKAMNVLGAIIGQITKAFQALINLDFGGVVDAVKGVGGAAAEASRQTDALFKAQKQLAELTRKFTVDNAKLKQQLEGQKKVLEDSSQPYEDRLAALKEINQTTETLAANQVALNKAQLAELQALLALEKNYEKRRELQQQIADAQASLIDSETELNNVRYDASRAERELQKEESERIKAQREERAAAAQERIQNAKDVESQLEALRLKSLTDESERIQQSLLNERKAAEEQLRLKGATEEQIAQLNAYYDELALQQQKAYDDKKAQEQAAADQAELDKLNAQEQAKLQAARAYQDELFGLESTAGMTRLELIAREEEQALELLKRRLEDGQLTFEQFQQLRTLTQEKYAEQRTENAKQEAENQKMIDEMSLQATADILGGLSDVLGKETELGKTAAIGQAYINTYLSATKAYQSLASIPIVGPALGAAAAGVAIAAGLKNIQIIRNPPKAALGGMVVGPSHAAGGVPIEAEGGEFIVNRAAMQVPGVAQMAMALNATARPKYANGGVVQDLQMQQDMFNKISNMPIKTYVVANEVTSAQSANFQIENLSRL